MGTRLVTIATFDQAAQARLAKNLLDEAGIRCAVTDETLVAMEWMLSNAVGGIKVQVWEEDADRALDLLEQKLGEEAAEEPVSPEELAAQAEAAVPEDVVEEFGPRVEPGDPPIARLSTWNRDEYARRGVFAAILGLMFAPVAFYAVYLLLNASFGSGEISARGRFNTLMGWWITLAALCVFSVFCGGLSYL